MIKGLENRIERYTKAMNAIVQVPQIVDKVVSANQDVLLSLNRDQLLLGRNTLGKVLLPTYLNDPYFKTIKAARAYSNMKGRLRSEHNSLLSANEQLYPNKGKNTPNLIVTGSFQNEMFITVGNGNYTMGSSYKATSSIENKYNNLIFGLAPRSKDYFYQQFIKEELIKALRDGV